jgi:hypothetical protein
MHEIAITFYLRCLWPTETTVVEESNSVVYVNRFASQAFSCSLWGGLGR